MKVFYVSLNALGTVFPEILWKKNFTVYPFLKKDSSLKIIYNI